MKDLDAIKALEALVKHFQRKSLGQSSEKPDLPELSAQIFAAVQSLLQLREDLQKDEAPAKRSFSRALRAPTQDEIYLACLRKIEKSAKRWNKRNGERGYLDFIVDFTP